MPDELVGAGSFRVDRKRALDKLMRFQLPDARMYPLPWVQAAVASEATFIRVVPQPAGLEFSFDGRHWGQDDMADPYRFLFDEDPDGAKTRHRELAIGLLTALRIPPQHVTATFLVGTQEWTLHVKDVTAETLEPGEERSRQRASMLLFVAAPLSFAREREFLQRYALHCPVPIEFARARIEAASAPPEPVLAAPFSQEGVSGEARLPQWAPDQSRVELVTHGVVVAEEWVRLPGAQLEAWARNDGFRKTLSQMGVVKDNYYLQAMGVLAQLSTRLVKEAALRASGRAADCGRLLLDADARSAWMTWEASGLAERLGALMAAGPGRPDAGAAALREQSLLVATLRQACLHRRDDILNGRSSDGLHDVLADAPTLYDAQARPLALRPLMAQARWLGHVPYIDGEPGADVGPLTAAWVVRGADRHFLEAFFPDQARRLKGSEAAAIDPAARPVLDDPNLLVKLPIMAGPVSGEIGLSLNPHPRKARLRWIGARGPLGTVAWSLKGLRLEAALHHPGLTQAPREDAPGEEARAALAAVLSYAPQLYQLLARDYAPEEDTPRAAVVREHLMDFLGLVCDARALDTPAAPWLARLPLMLDRQGRRVSLEDLRRRSKDGKKTPVRAVIHPDRLMPLVAGYPDHVRELFTGSDRVEVLSPAAPAPKADASLRPPRTARVQPAPPAPPAAEVWPRPKTARIEPPAPPAVPPGEPAGELVVDPAGELKRVLHALRQRGACQVPEPAIEALRVVSRGKGPFMRYHPDQAWELDLANPLAKPLAGLPPSAALPFLASLAHTALNRALAGLTDAQDAAFDAALAQWTLEDDAA